MVADDGGGHKPGVILVHNVDLDLESGVGMIHVGVLD